MNSFKKHRGTILVFLGPALLVYTVFLVLPVLVSFYFSFHEWPGFITAPLKYVGLRNFRELMTDDLFLQSLKNVLVYIFFNVIGQVFLGYLIAFCIYHLRSGIRFFKGAYFIPMILPATAIALLWGFIFFPTDMGVLNNFLTKIGLGSFSRIWLVDPKVALGCVIVVTIWSSIGYYMTIGLASLVSIPDSLLESATLDGAGLFHRVVFIMIPLIWDSIKVSVILVITGVLKIFDLIFILTPNGGPGGVTHVPATMMYNVAFKYNRYGMGSAVSTVIFLLSIIITLMSLKIMNREDIQ